MRNKHPLEVGTLRWRSARRVAGKDSEGSKPEDIKHGGQLPARIVVEANAPP